MKRLTLLLVLLLAACGQRDGAEDNQTVPLQQDLLAGLDPLAAGPDTARLQAMIDRAMPAALPDAAKAQYRNLRAGVGGSVCGEVATPASNGKAGPFRHFVITPEAVAVVGTEPGVKINDPEDFLADAWIRWCASPEELKSVEAELGGPRTPAVDSSAGLQSADADEPMLAEPQPLRTASAGPPSRSPPDAPPAQIDSFSQSVSRPQ